MIYNAGNNVSGRVRPRTRAVPEGRQAEWNGVLSRSEIKRETSSNPSPPTKKRPERDVVLWVKMDSNHRSRETADLQSAPFGHSGIHPA